MKWVKVITTVRREDWVQVTEDPNDAIDHIRGLVENDARLEFMSANIERETVIPPLRQTCNRQGIGYHPL
jgi:hypothetical protein